MGIKISVSSKAKGKILNIQQTTFRKSWLSPTKWAITILAWFRLSMKIRSIWFLCVRGISFNKKSEDSKRNMGWLKIMRLSSRCPIWRERRWLRKMSKHWRPRGRRRRWLRIKSTMRVWPTKREREREMLPFCRVHKRWTKFSKTTRKWANPAQTADERHTPGTTCSQRACSL